MTSTTTPTAAWSPPRHRAGRLTPPLLAAAIVTLPAVAAALSGHLSLVGLVAVFVVALSVALLAATLGLRLVHYVDGPSSRPVASPNSGAPHSAVPSSGTPLGRVPVARIPAHQAIDGSAPQAARPGRVMRTNPSASTSQDTDMHRSAPTPGSPR